MERANSSSHCSDPATNGGSLKQKPRKPSVGNFIEKIGAVAVPGAYKDPAVATIAEQVRRYDRKHVKKAVSFSQRFIIDPRSSVWIGWWDGVISISLVFTALCTPVEVGFLSIPPDKWKDPLFLVNRMVDLAFIFDMMLQFVLMVTDATMEPVSGLPPLSSSLMTCN